MRDHVDLVDSTLFVARDGALDVTARLLDEHGRFRLLLVDGGIGVGKSALLREVGRRASAQGFDVLSIGADSITTVTTALRERRSLPHPKSALLVLVDEMPSSQLELNAVREVLLSELATNARAIIASRTRADSSWFTEGIDAVTLRVTLGPLTPDESAMLLARRDVTDATQVEQITSWAGGLPLALCIAATAIIENRDVTSPIELGREVIRALADDSLDGVDRQVLEVASVAAWVDSRLLAAALPGHSTRGAVTTLLELPSVDNEGGRAVLHPLVAATVSEELAHTNPQRHATLKTRIADHLQRRALGGETEALVGLAHLVDDPEFGRLLGSGTSTTHIVVPGAAADLDEVARSRGLEQTPGWTHLRRLLVSANPHTIAVREHNGRYVGVATLAPAATVTAELFPAMAPVLEYMKLHDIDESTTVIGVGSMISPFANPLDAIEVLRIGNTGMVLACGVPNPRFIFANFWNDIHEQLEFSRDFGYQHLTTLDRTVDGAPVTTWFGDYGPGGLIGYLRGFIGTSSEQSSPRVITVDGARTLARLEHYHAATARPAQPAEPRDADHGRDELDQLVTELDAVFSKGARDARLRDVIELSYLRPDIRESAMLEHLHVSRSTYYRLLRAARERILSS